MLVLTRKIGERIVIGDNITLEVLKVCGDRVRLGVVAPNDVQVHRQEVYLRVQAEEAELTASAEPQVAEPAQYDEDVLPMSAPSKSRRPSQDEADRRRRSFSGAVAAQSHGGGLRSRVQARSRAATTR